MISRLLALCLVLSSFVVSAAAESAGDIRRRMDQRLAVLDELRLKEVVGENNRGFVEIRTPAPGADRVVADENRDREAIYALIARETGASAESVGRARARQIAAHSRSGVWIQDERGNWAKK